MRFTTFAIMLITITVYIVIVVTLVGVILIMVLTIIIIHIVNSNSCFRIRVISVNQAHYYSNIVVYLILIGSISFLHVLPACL